MYFDSYYELSLSLILFYKSSLYRELTYKCKLI